MILILPKCITKYCRNERLNDRNVCIKCKTKIWKENNPEKYAYKNLKSNAKRRGKEFTLTFEEFKEFAIKSDYINKKGITKKGWHIDRIDNSKGYSIDNIQVLTNVENIKKYLTYDVYGGRKCNFNVQKQIVKHDQQTPF